MKTPPDALIQSLGEHSKKQEEGKEETERKGKGKNGRSRGPTKDEKTPPFYPGDRKVAQSKHPPGIGEPPRALEGVGIGKRWK